MQYRALILGTEGTQSFPITNHFVSRNHCRVSYDPNTRMFTVEDLNTPNGTFIMDDSNGLENLQFYRVTRVSVPHGTWLNLGGTHIGQGQRVLVDHLLKNEIGPDGKTRLDYSSEFRTLSRKYDEYEASLRNIQERNRRQQKIFNWVKVGISVGFLLIIGALQHYTDWGPIKQPGVMMGASILTMVVSNLINFEGNRKAIETLRKNAKEYFVCPKCGQSLSEFSIRQRACQYCKAQ